MKLFKPQQLSILTRTFENEGRVHLVISAFVFVDLLRPRRVYHEAVLWKEAVEELEGAPLDEAMIKKQGEVLVGGSAYAKAGQPAAAVTVRVRVGAAPAYLVDKELTVIGDRRWELAGMTPPAPFERMPLTWERAFGGEGFDANPVGRGVKPVDVDGKKVHPLPNVEDPKRMVKSASDKPSPAGFAPLSIESPVRMKKSGTYDDAWLKTRFPDVAADFDWSFHNVAPEDQWIKGHFRGDERFELTGMHPEHRVIEGELPGVSARVLVVKKAEDGAEVVQEVATRLDTLFFLPGILRGVLVYRGTCEIADDDMKDVAAIIGALEDAGTQRTQAEYLAVRASREDPKLGVVRSLDDAALLPASLEPQSAVQASDMVDLVKSDDILTKRMEAATDHQIEQAREHVRSFGHTEAEVKRLVPDRKASPKPPETPQEILEAVELAEATRADAEAMAEKEREATIARLKADFARSGVAFDPEALAGKDKGGPPEFSADKQLEWIRSLVELRRNAGFLTADEEARSLDPGFEASLRAVEKQLFDAYRRYTHYFPAAKPRGADVAQEARARVEAALGDRTSLAKADLTWVDLSGLDLSGVDLREAMLEHALLGGVSLRGADLSGATLSRADLERADLGGAKLVGVNFGAARVLGTRFGVGADLSGAVFERADLSGASLEEAKLVQAQFHETRGVGASFRGANLDKAIFLDADFSEASFEGCSLVEAVFLRCKLPKARFGGAVLKETTFVETNVVGGSFAGAKLENARAVMGSAFDDADFKGSRWLRTCFRTSSMKGADFTGAEMPEVDLSECDLSGANLYRANLQGSILIRTDFRGAKLTSANLMSTILQKALLHGADLRGANLFRADMAKFKGDKATKLDDAYRVQVRVVPDRRPT